MCTQVVCTLCFFNCSGCIILCRGSNKRELNTPLPSINTQRNVLPQLLCPRCTCVCVRTSTRRSTSTWLGYLARPTSQQAPLCPLWLTTSQCSRKGRSPTPPLPASRSPSRATMPEGRTWPAPSRVSSAMCVCVCVCVCVVVKHVMFVCRGGTTVWCREHSDFQRPAAQEEGGSVRSHPRLPPQDMQV